jgi:hypothetical protein
MRLVSVQEWGEAEAAATLLLQRTRGATAVVTIAFEPPAHCNHIFNNY